MSRRKDTGRKRSSPDPLAELRSVKRRLRRATYRHAPGLIGYTNPHITVGGSAFRASTFGASALTPMVAATMMITTTSWPTQTINIPPATWMGTPAVPKWPAPTRGTRPMAPGNGALGDLQWSEIPDGITPVVGVRSLRLMDDVFKGTKYNLMSINNTIWPAGQRLEAQCVRGGISNHEHVPDPYCSCGIYLAKPGHKATADSYLLGGLGGHGKAVAIMGVIKGWGNVIGHEYGYRVQYAYPKELHIIRARETSHQEVKRERQSFADRYMVPTFVWEMNTREQGTVAAAYDTRLKLVQRCEPTGIELPHIIVPDVATIAELWHRG